MNQNLRGIQSAASILVVFFYISMAMAVATIAANSAFLANYEFPSPVDGIKFHEVVSLLGILVLVVNAIFWSRWIYIASKNLWDLFPGEMTFTPASCIWWNLVPIALLFKPYQAMREIHGMSVGESTDYTASDKSLLTLWWGCWIAGAILGQVSWRLPESGTVSVDLISAFVSLGLFWFARQLVNEITEAQLSGKTGLSEVFA